MTDNNELTIITLITINKQNKLYEKIFNFISDDCRGDVVMGC